MESQESPLRLAWWKARGGPWTRGDDAVVALVLFAILVRWWDRARYLMSWDSHTFAIALTDYDVNGLHPHAPGYPVYVALGRLVHALVGDANASYIILSLVFTAAGLLMAYDLGRRMLGRGIAIGATVLLLAAPLVYSHSVTANVYTADLLCSVAVAWLSWRTRSDPSRRNLVVLALVTALSIGVRPSLSFFLGPMLLWAVLHPPYTVAAQFKRLAVPAVVGALACLVWFIPMALASGGFSTWSRANDLQSDVVFEHPVWRDGWGMVEVNAERMALYLHWEITVILPALAGLLLLGALTRFLRGGIPLVVKMRDGPERTASWFLLLWALPPTLFYLGVYSGYGNGPSGYALILLPPLFLALAGAGAWGLGVLRWPARRTVLVGILALGLPAVVLAGNVHTVKDVNYQEHDAWVEDWMGLPAGFPPSNSSIVSAYNFAHLWYYYQDYDVYEYRPAGKAVGEVPDFLMIQHAKGGKATPNWYDEIADHHTPRNTTLPATTKNLVLFDFQLAGENEGQRQLKDDIPVLERKLPNGWRVLYVEVTPDKPHLDDYFVMEDLG